MNTNSGTITASAGTGAATLIAGNNILMHIFVKAATSSTTFDVSLTDVYDNVVLRRIDQTGELNELLALPSFDYWTLTVENSSADEDFTYLTVARET